MATLQQNLRDLGGGVAKSNMDLQARLASECLGFRVLFSSNRLLGHTRLPEASEDSKGTI